MNTSVLFRDAHSAKIMDEVLCIVRDYPIAYNTVKSITDVVVNGLSKCHTVARLTDRSVVVDGYRMSLCIYNSGSMHGQTLAIHVEEV